MEPDELEPRGGYPYPELPEAIPEYVSASLSDSGDSSGSDDLTDEKVPIVLPPCWSTRQCLAACEDACALDCLWGCWDTSPDCLGEYCEIRLECDECP